MPAKPKPIPPGAVSHNALEPGYAYKYGAGTREFVKKAITVRYKTPDGMKERTFTAYFTHHGPVVRSEGNVWFSIRMMNIPVPALEQSFLRTKARN